MLSFYSGSGVISPSGLPELHPFLFPACSPDLRSPCATHPSLSQPCSLFLGLLLMSMCVWPLLWSFQGGSIPSRWLIPLVLGSMLCSCTGTYPRMATWLLAGSDTSPVTLVPVGDYVTLLIQGAVPYLQWDCQQAACQKPRT